MDHKREVLMLAIKNLQISLEAENNPPRTMVRQAGFQVAPHRPFTLIGETGCGKSLIAHAIFDLLPPEMKISGQLNVLGRDLLNHSGRAIRRMWGQEVFLFPQEPGTALNPLCRSRSQVVEIFRRVCRDRFSRARSDSLWKTYFHKVGLSSRDGKKFPWELSGGMSQRLLAVMAMAEPAQLIVADEPTKGLDPPKRRVTLDLLRKMSDMGKGLMVITHDLEVPRQLGGDLAVMYAGTILESGPAEKILNQPCHPYTRALLKALPENGLHPIPLRVNGNTFQGGCRFSPRCINARPHCFQIEPSEQNIKKQLTVSITKHQDTFHVPQPKPTEETPHIIRCHYDCTG